jgi:D-galactarolactone cycloisomerase
MNITEVIPHPLSVPLKQPSWTAHEISTTATLILVEVRTDDGIVGYGEVQGGPQKDIYNWIVQFGDLIRGMNALGHVDVWEKLFALTSPRPGGIAPTDGLPPPLPRGQRPQIMAAIGGIDIALWDIKGKAAKMPIYQLLGGSQPSVFTYATGGYYVEGAPLSACAEELTTFVEKGYRAVKMKTGALPLADEITRIQMTREAIGDALLMLDMNAPYTVADCIRFARAVEPFDIYWLEEPLHWYLQPDDYVHLAAATSIPLAHGEREWHRFAIREFLKSGALTFVQFDSTRHAGFTESLRIAHLAEQMGVCIAPHTAPHLHAHLVAAFGDKAFGAESHGDPDRHPIQHHLYSGGPEFRDGRLHLSDRPGFGIAVDRDYLTRYHSG